MQEYYIGVDAGGTKTAFVLVDSKAQVISQYMGPSCNYMVNGLDTVVDVLCTGINAMLQDAKLSNKQIAGSFISIAGFKDIKSDVVPITFHMKKMLPIKHFILGNDVENAFAGSLGGENGIQIIAGTGSIGFGRNSSGETLRVGGWHHVFNGDEGSGYWIAVRLLQMFSKQADYRAPRTELYQHMKRKLNLKDDYKLIKIVTEKWESDRAKIASVSKLCTSLAKQGDPVAIDIFKDAADELSQIILAIKEQIMDQETVKVSYSGGVFKAGKYILEPLEHILNEKHCILVKPKYSPLAGSVILALQSNHKTLTNTIKSNLKKIV